MFGLRRRHRKAQPAPPAIPDPQSDLPARLSEEQVFDAVHARLEEFMGADGTWSLVRRDPDSVPDDGIFSSMSTILLAKDIVSSVLGSPGSASTAPDTVAEVASAPEVATQAAEEKAPSMREKDLRDMLRPVPRDDAQSQVALELTTIATWADPQHHDPDHVDPDLVSPAPTTASEARGA